METLVFKNVRQVNEYLKVQFVKFCSMYILIYMRTLLGSGKPQSYTFISVFMGSMLSFCQHNQHKSSQILTHCLLSLCFLKGTKGPITFSAIRYSSIREGEAPHCVVLLLWSQGL